MGHLIYDNSATLRIDDWSLAHLQTVIITKLRRDEAFALSWDAEPGVTEITAGDRVSAAGTIWLSRGSSLHFSFEGERPQRLNPRWLVALANAANGNGGLRLVAEPSS